MIPMAKLSTTANRDAAVEEAFSGTGTLPTSHLPARLDSGCRRRSLVDVALEGGTRRGPGFWRRPRRSVLVHKSRPEIVTGGRSSSGGSKSWRP
jgi:hypothetical protein